MSDSHTLNSASAHLRGLLFVLVGPSGVGKNAIIERVLSQLPSLRRLPTYTTRPKRPNEEEGRDHFFVTLERFQAMVAKALSSSIRKCIAASSMARPTASFTTDCAKARI
jgi:Cdc6-like AAA superfamily ATPase